MNRRRPATVELATQLGLASAQAMYNGARRYENGDTSFGSPAEEDEVSKLLCQRLDEAMEPRMDDLLWGQLGKEEFMGIVKTVAAERFRALRNQSMKESPCTAQSH